MTRMTSLCINRLRNKEFTLLSVMCCVVDILVCSVREFWFLFLVSTKLEEVEVATYTPDIEFTLSL